MLLTTALASALVPFSDGLIEGPEPEDVKAGYVALFVFLGLTVAVVLLAFSLVKQLRKAQAAKDAGVYGDEPVAPDDGRGTND
jgi:hypothetical protein